MCVVCLAVIGGCKSPTKAGQTVFFEWTDSYGREVQLTEEPQRILSLSPAITEILFLIDAQDKIVGVSDFCDYPEAAKLLPKAGGMQNVNIEVLVSMKPDVVLIGSVVPKKTVEAIEKLNIPVITIKVEDKIERMSEMILVLGDITGHTAQAAKKAAEWTQTLATIKKENQVKEMPKKRLYYVVGYGDAGDFTAPKQSHIDEIIHLSGCENVGSALSQWNVNKEFLFQSDPDIIFIREEDYKAFCTQRPYKQLRAVKRGHVFPIESGWIDIVSLRNLLAIQRIKAICDSLS